MSKKFAVVLISVGDRKETVLGHLRDILKLEYQKVLKIMGTLPNVITTLEDQSKAYEVKSELEMLGAKVEIKEIQSTGPLKLKINLNTAKKTGSIPNIDSQSGYVSPVQQSKGCLTIILSGFLITFLALITAII